MRLILPRAPHGPYMMSSVMGSERHRRVAGVVITLLVGAGMLAGQLVAEGSAGAVLTQEVQRAANRPNIILISTDDMTASDLRWMPRTRKMLGRAGVTFPTRSHRTPSAAPRGRPSSLVSTRRTTA